MDIITQGLLGSNLALSGTKRSEIRIAAITGFFAGLLADADILIRSSSDPLLTIEYHRHFTHSIFFIPIGALIATLILWPFFRKKTAFRRIYFFSFMGYSLSGFLDACTSYGTHLFWPVSSERVSFNVISIIDPVFTSLLLISLILVIKKRRNAFASMGLLLAGCYLLLGWYQHDKAVLVAEDIAKSRGHTMERLIVKPTLGNLLLWRSIYQSDGELFVDGIRIGLLSGIKHYEGKSTRLFVLKRDMNGLMSTTVLYEDIKRFIKFSDGFVAYHSETKDMLGDIRYSGLPTSLKPLWVIRFDRNNPENHAVFTVIRSISNDDRERFISMLFRSDEQ